MLFKPGTYTADVNLGFFTQVAGLGMSPDDVNLNGHVRVEAFWFGGNATQNFWRAAENLSVTLPAGITVERCAVSQAAPYRRMHLRGARQPDPALERRRRLVLRRPDGRHQGRRRGRLRLAAAVVLAQQRVRQLDRLGLEHGVPGRDRARRRTTSRTRRTPSSRTTPVVREKPFLYFDGTGEYRVFVPALRAEPHRHELVRQDAGRHVACRWPTSSSSGPAPPPRPSTPPSPRARTCWSPRARTTSTRPIHITRPDTVVLGLGLATLAADNGVTAMTGRGRRRGEGRRHHVRRRCDQLAVADGGRRAGLQRQQRRPTRSRCTTSSSGSADRASGGPPTR